MIKFNATDAWYREAASQELEVDSTQCGSAHLEREVERRGLLKDTRSLRRREGFSSLLRMLRLKHKYSYRELAHKIMVQEEELILLERQVGFVANPRTLSKLANFYKINTQKFLQLSGAAKDIDQKLEEEVTRFAAESESFDKLTKEEKQLLNKLVKFLSE